MSAIDPEIKDENYFRLSESAYDDSFHRMGMLIYSGSDFKFRRVSGDPVSKELFPILVRPEFGSWVGNILKEQPSPWYSAGSQFHGL